MGKLEHLPFEFETAETMLHLLGPGVSGAEVANQTEYASEKLAYGHAVLDLQHAGQYHGRGRAWEWVLWRVLARAGSGLVGKVATGLGLGREGRERSRLAEHGHDGKAAIFAMFSCYFA